VKLVESVMGYEPVFRVVALPLTSAGLRFRDNRRDRDMVRLGV